MNLEDNLPKILPPKTDVVFKLLFGNERNSDILIDFLKAVLRKNIESVKLLDPTLKPEHPDDKKGILDVKAELDNGEKIDIEIQVRNIAEMRKRILYYNSRLLTEQIGAGEPYTLIKPAISIIITDYPLIHETDKCHNVFLWMEKDEHFVFDDLQEIHILHLSRVGKEEVPAVSDWVKFIGSDNEEDFIMLAEKNSVIKKAFGELKLISADKASRMLYEARMKELHDAYAAEETARRQGLQQGIQQGMQKMLDLLKKGISFAEAEKMIYAR